MSEKRSIIAYKIHRETADRFEYYVVGLVGALCAYVSQHMEPQKLGNNPYTMELAALVLLICAFAAGFRRIHLQTILSGLNQEIIHFTEVRGSHLCAIQDNPIGQLRNAETGELFTSKDAHAKVKQATVEIETSTILFEESHKKAVKCYKIRNWCLCVGFALLIISRIIVPYYPH